MKTVVMVRTYLQGASDLKIGDEKSQSPSILGSR